MENKYLLILFYSAGGSVRNIAHAIADGAEECNLNVKIRTVPKVSSVSEQVERKSGRLDRRHRCGGRVGRYPGESSGGQGRIRLGFRPLLWHDRSSDAVAWPLCVRTSFRCGNHLH